MSTDLVRLQLIAGANTAWNGREGKTWSRISWVTFESKCDYTQDKNGRDFLSTSGRYPRLRPRVAGAKVTHPQSAFGNPVDPSGGDATDRRDGGRPTSLPSVVVGSRV